jgi:hypothetical protein
MSRVAPHLLEDRSQVLRLVLPLVLVSIMMRALQGEKKS